MVKFLVVKKIRVYVVLAFKIYIYIYMSYMVKFGSWKNKSYIVTYGNILIMLFISTLNHEQHKWVNF